MLKENIRILQTQVLSDDWYVLKKITYEYRTKDGAWQAGTREAYDRGNGATILLFNKETSTVMLTKQFRLPTFINGNATGMLIETCAGLLDKDDPEDCIKRETEEETGYRISKPVKVFEAYMSPGSVTELLYFFIAEYSSGMRVGDGGGVAHEQENIEAIEMDFDNALHQIDTGEIKDGKTIMLLQYLRLKGLL